MEYVWYGLGGCCCLGLLIAGGGFVFLQGMGARLEKRDKERRLNRQKKKENGAPIISALLLEGESFPVDAFLKQVNKTKFLGESATNVDRGDGIVFSFNIGDDLLALALMPAHYPASDLE